MADDTDYDVLLSNMENALSYTGDYRQLRKLRQLLDQPAFIFGLKDYITLTKGNEPGVVEGRIRYLRRLAEELGGGLADDSTWLLGAGGTVSGGLVVGAILSAATAPSLALLYAVFGIFTGGVSYFGLKKMNREKLLCSQIADALSNVEKAL